MKRKKTKANKHNQIPFTPPKQSLFFTHSSLSLHPNKHQTSTSLSFFYSFSPLEVVGEIQQPLSTMEVISRPQENNNPSPPTNSPSSHGSSPSPSPSPSPHHQIQTPPLTPKTISRSETNPYPTTFVQADTTTFKQVVQMLTGSSETAKQAYKTTPSSSDSSQPSQLNNKSCIPPIRTAPKKQGFKLYERRNSLKNGLMISPLVPGFVTNSGFSPRNKPDILSPSVLDFPSLAISPVTPLNEDPFNKSSSPSLGSSSEEEKAIAEKKFYLLPSPRTSSTTPRDAQPPQLLPLFPLTSPKVSGPST